jgi:hypothetical protein
MVIYYPRILCAGELVNFLDVLKRKLRCHSHQPEMTVSTGPPIHDERSDWFGSTFPNFVLRSVCTNDLYHGEDEACSRQLEIGAI